MRIKPPRRHPLGEPTTHIDGSICPEGTAALPANRTLCCRAFEARTRACYYDVRYEWQQRRRNWVIAIPPDAGGGGVAISHCPHCGKKLAGRDRQGRWFDL